ncbi:MAG: hypothetical protein ACI4ML_07055 [Aristaeellaceae bacterium]
MKQMKEVIPMAKKSRTDRKQMVTRAVCMALAVVMIGTVVLAAVLSQVF